MNERVTSKARVLVVDDSPTTVEVIRRNLQAEGYEVRVAACVDEAIRVLNSACLDLVITDLKMPGPNGMVLVNHVGENFPDMEVIMITGHPTINGAVSAIKGGADEYLVKPFTDVELLSAVEKSLQKLLNRRVVTRKLEELSDSRFGLVGRSIAMKRVFDLIQKAAQSHATVLINGESGTGKELVARAIHYMSRRRSAPFVPVNCVAIPEPLLESELFGHVKGAFTGAVESRAGFFQTAEGGTIFLDEIGDMSHAMQARLLRVLQENEVCMVGSTKIGQVDVRTIAATNKDLQMLTRKGLFREDLYYRLNVITIGLPPLRERDDDVLVLAQYFANRFCREYEKELIEFSDEVLDVFRTYEWPGNVRELENLVHRIVVMADHKSVDTASLPAHLRTSYVPGRVPDSELLSMTLEQAESAYVARVLESVSGNKSRAAEILGIDRKTLRKKLECGSPISPLN